MITAASAAEARKYTDILALLLMPNSVKVSAVMRVISPTAAITKIQNTQRRAMGVDIGTMRRCSEAGANTTREATSSIRSETATNNTDSTT